MVLAPKKVFVTAKWVMAIAALCLGRNHASAAIVTPTSSSAALKAALFGGGGAGIDLSSVSMSVAFNTKAGQLSVGTYSNASGTYGIGPGVILSSGSVADYGDGPNTSGSKTTNFDEGGAAAATAAQELLLDPITGGGFNHFDVTQIDVMFDMLPGSDKVFFNVVFGSEEYSEFVGSSFIDGFGLYVNGVNVAFVGGQPVNINHPDMAFVPGTELDGILTGGNFSAYVHTFSAPALATGNKLTFIVADASDSVLDTTVYLSQLGGSPPPPPPVVPEPATVALWSVGGAIGLLIAARRRRIVA